MGKRVDNILIINNLICVIEFKVGDRNYSNYAQNQTIDHCLELTEFFMKAAIIKRFPFLLLQSLQETI